MDIAHYEKFLIELILNASCLCSDVIRKTPQRSVHSDTPSNHPIKQYHPKFTKKTPPYREIADGKTFAHCTSCCSFGNAAAAASVDEKSAASDMADSGLETGSSMVSPQETISENWSTDLDEPSEATIPSKNNGLPKSFGEHPGDRRDSSREARRVSDAIPDYEVHRTTQPFYDESDDDDDVGEANSYVPTTSFDITETGTVFFGRSGGKTSDGKSLKIDIAQNGQKPNITIEVSKHIMFCFGGDFRDFIFILFYPFSFCVM